MGLSGEPVQALGKDPQGIMKRINGELAKRGFMTYTDENKILVAPPLIITAGQLAEEMAVMNETLNTADGMVG
ncbi:MAG: hypothetical protein LBF74_03670 [Treponema sp.]|jgi:taurine--2-oxoglutarate transaminase|nr:hypothetical protein [Treponema sp.]